MTALAFHGSMIPTISEQQYNPVRDNNTDGRCPVEVTVRNTVTHIITLDIMYNPYCTYISIKIMFSITKQWRPHCMPYSFKL